MEFMLSGKIGERFKLAASMESRDETIMRRAVVTHDELFGPPASFAPRAQQQPPARHQSAPSQASRGGQQQLKGGSC